MKPGIPLANNPAIPTARLVSIIGHPAVIMPTAAVVASAGASRAIATTAVLVAVAIALLVLAYGFYKTRRGDWAHIDASGTGERAQLNTRLGSGLLVVAAVLAVVGTHVAIVAVVALSGLMILAGHLLRRSTKLSLHLAFATFAIFIVWPQFVAAIILLLVAPAIGWSRLVLGRHVRGDLVWGAGVGALAGVMLQALRFLIAD